MQFRQKALSKLQSPDDLDLPVHLARPQGRMVLAVTVVVMAAAIFWAFQGSVSPVLTASGILTYGEGSYTLQSPVAGQVTTLLANPGDLVAANAPLLTVRTDRGTLETVRAVAAGRVTELGANIGAVVTVGANLATLEKVNSPDDPLLAVLYPQSGSAPTIPVGATVDLTVQSVPSDRYGVLEGTVLAAGTVPQTQQQIADFLGDTQLASQFTAQGQPLAVVVKLERSPGTSSGYTWSRPPGPPYAITDTTIVSGTVHLTAQHPISWILP
ncbi:HlyD family efflux transporter periplasmic adaptor subunit [Streptacidiphilus fuscans]|uniref:HlyD family efflux transporter periplasmic adaptor subunit n=1 Tax=Streptacidiphilus fuscans TaxID=2789292 RepID=A0A931FIP8_9ACTN|nr:HlyD family efflux transporter periplasmic adaptor subunit [Streptacidiphilus fuscans]MBF9072004.1 HlyD family efflux transporter periplasmic adaptor subunit [Streptacidiphilus fuscans]